MFGARFSLEETNVDLSFYETVYTSSRLANSKSIAEGGEKTSYNAPFGWECTFRPPAHRAKPIRRHFAYLHNL